MKKHNYKLKPCPFCAETNIDVRTRKTTLVECTKCGALFCGTDEIETTLRWNVRVLAVDLSEIQTKLVNIMVAGCTCMTKTPELSFHFERCHYRLASEVLNLLHHKTSEKI